MPKITKIVNGEYIGGEKYTITDAGEGKSTILFTPDTVIKDGTPVGAEILNEMQKNGVYSLNGTRIISGQKEIYTCNIEGIVDFGLFDIVLIMTPNATNTMQNVVIDLSGTEFQIISYVGSIAIGELSLNVPYIFKLNISAKKAFLIGSEKLNRGTYSGKADDLKTDIDGKLDKYQNVIDEKINYDDIAADGFYIARGTAQGGINAPFDNQALVQVWRFAGFVRQEAVSYYSAGQTACRIFSYDVKNTPWVYNYNAENLKPTEIVTTFARGNVGLSGSIRYIQTAGTKTAGNLYYDNSSTPAKPYLCVNTTTDVTPTSNFISANNAELTNRIKTITEQSSVLVTSTNGHTTLNFIKIGRVVQIYISTRGGSIVNQFSAGLPTGMRPSSAIYLGFPSVSGSPYLVINANGTIAAADNGATMHTVTSTTTYSFSQSYISANY